MILYLVFLLWFAAVVGTPIETAAVIYGRMWERPLALRLGCALVAGGAVVALLATWEDMVIVIFPLLLVLAYEARKTRRMRDAWPRARLLVTPMCRILLSLATQIAVARRSPVAVARRISQARPDRYTVATLLGLAVMAVTIWNIR
jgi:hypothetical protein